MLAMHEAMLYGAFACTTPDRDPLSDDICVLEEARLACDVPGRPVSTLPKYLMTAVVL